MPATCPASFSVTPPPTRMPHQRPDLLPSRHHFIYSTQLPTPRVTPQTLSMLLTVSSPNFHPDHTSQPSSSLSPRQAPFQKNPVQGLSPSLAHHHRPPALRSSLLPSLQSMACHFDYSLATTLLSSLPGRASLWLKPALHFLPICTREAQEAAETIP